MTSSKLNSLLKAPAPNTILLGVRASTGEFWATESLTNYMREVFILCFLDEVLRPHRADSGVQDHRAGK